MINSQEHDRLTIERSGKSPFSSKHRHIKAYAESKEYGPTPFLNPFMFGEIEGTEKVKVGGGSGFIVSSRRIGSNNKHVVFDADCGIYNYHNGWEEYQEKLFREIPLTILRLLK